MVVQHAGIPTVSTHLGLRPEQEIEKPDSSICSVCVCVSPRPLLPACVWVDLSRVGAGQSGCSGLGKGLWEGRSHCSASKCGPTGVNGSLQHRWGSSSVTSLQLPLQDPFQSATSVSFQSCWNCGRKASETCSGCNIARYCGSFCQHKDWERHHRICGQSLHGHSKGLALPAGRSAKGMDGVPSPSMEKSSAATSRSSTPASVTAIDTNGL